MELEWAWLNCRSSLQGKVAAGQSMSCVGWSSYGNPRCLLNLRLHSSPRDWLLNRDPYIIHLSIALNMLVSLYLGGKSHVSNWQHVSFKEPRSIASENFRAFPGPRSSAGMSMMWALSKPSLSAKFWVLGSVPRDMNLDSCATCELEVAHRKVVTHRALPARVTHLSSCQSTSTCPQGSKPRQAAASKDQGHPW